VINDDAFRWLDKVPDRFDFIVVDFPDPTNYSLGKLFTTTFYRLAAKHLATGGLMVVQSTSPLFARQSYWCIVETVKQAGLRTYPYHVYVPSFGEWGYVIGSVEPFEPPSQLPAGLRFLSARNVGEMFVFPVDMQPVEAEPNRLNDQILVRYYEREWKDIAR
jgi:spermidine synthase